MTNTGTSPQKEECDHLSELYKQGAIAGNQLIKMSVQEEIAWGKTVGVSLALQCPSSEGGSTVQLASNDGYLTQNLLTSISVPSGTGDFSFEIPADGHNYPDGKEVTITATYDGYSASLPIGVPPFSEETSSLSEVNIPIDPIFDPNLIAPPTITIPPEALQQAASDELI